MKLVLVGLNHRTAPVKLREQLAFRSEEIPAALSAFQANGAKEVLIISTCNRVEVTAVVDDAAATSGSIIDRLLTFSSRVASDDLRPHFYSLEDGEAIRHMFRVASSLDSMIVGEPQILGQLSKPTFRRAKWGP